MEVIQIGIGSYMCSWGELHVVIRIVVSTFISLSYLDFNESVIARASFLAALASSKDLIKAVFSLFKTANWPLTAFFFLLGLHNSILISFYGLLQVHLGMFLKINCIDQKNGHVKQNANNDVRIDIR